MGDVEPDVLSILAFVRQNHEIAPTSDTKFHYPEIETLLDTTAERVQEILAEMESKDLLRHLEESTSVGCPNCSSLSLLRQNICPICSSDQIEVQNEATGMMVCSSCQNVFYFPATRLKCDSCETVLPEIGLSMITANSYGITSKGLGLISERKQEGQEDVFKRMMASIFFALILTFTFAVYLIYKQKGFVDIFMFVLYGTVILSYMITSYYIGKSGVSNTEGSSLPSHKIP
ncbi:MAG: hypothetical protein QF415_14340 [Candidatus Undinarchaeales archaeon]|jgi:LSD1 subclass zinc finger protein|nr:hypothetical protein [Candidatus Undinarchaeales archaeon]MDP7494564.1 hypothetical protein [Candidatus Undinarchaeales archaeon]